MKFIFDFDDVLFYNTEKLKRHIYLCLDNAGVSYNTAETYYKKIRGGEFSLKNFILDLLKKEKIKEIKMEDVYEDIMSKCPDFINKELVDIVRKLGKENCYLVTYGEKEFNKEKVERSGIAPLFCEINVVSGSKKEIIERICAKHKNEKAVFIDDVPKHFENLDFKKYPNLKTILFDDKGLEKLKTEISKA